MVSFRHVKRITTEPNSIFYTLLTLPENKFIGFGRKNCPARILKKVILNDKLDIIEDKNETFRGEDPRSFYFNNKMYVIDNYLNDMYLIEHDTAATTAASANKFTRICMPGKNLSFIPHAGNLYFMHFIKPFILYTCNADTGICEKVAVGNHENTYDYEYRGGTPGYPVKGTDNQYFGFGHRTYMVCGVMTHDVFKWVVTFPTDCTPPTIEYFDVEQPPGSKNICDPTSVVVINDRDSGADKLYLITAETDETWFHNQDYITNVYEIVD